MSDPAYALQDAIHDALKGATDAGDNVFDSPPRAASFPWITIGRGDSSPVNEEADPECGYDPTEVFPIIDVWSQKTGYPEAKTIAGQVREALHNQHLDLAGFHMELPLTLRDLVPDRAEDGKTSLVRMVFSARVAADTSP